MNSNSIVMIGTGYVGLVSGTCLAEFGFNVICVDSNEEKIKLLNEGVIPIYEPGLKELLDKNRLAKRITFTSNLIKAIECAETIFISVGTPPNEDGSADVTNILQAARDIAYGMDGYRLIVVKSTVPVGTTRKIKETMKNILNKRGKKIKFDVASNPEFLREGSAIRDFMHPDRIVIGTETEKAKDILKNIYNVLYLIDVPFVFTSIETAELIKYASNAFLATKISFINEIANLCDEINSYDQMNIDVHDVAKAMGLDGRIGKYFLHPGPGFGGSCLPKDTKALLRIGDTYGIKLKIVDALISVNENQPLILLSKIKRKMGNLRGRILAVLGLAYKQNTDDIRESPSIKLISLLANEGAIIRAYDPVVINKACIQFASKDKVIFCKDEYEAAKKVDAIVIATEWNQFRHLNLNVIRANMRGNLIFDFRNIYEPHEVRKLGFDYEGVGRK